MDNVIFDERLQFLCEKLGQPQQAVLKLAVDNLFKAVLLEQEQAECPDFQPTADGTFERSCKNCQKIQFCETYIANFKG